MFNAIIESVQSHGLNVIDTAINYRGQKSERVVGAALRYLIEQGYERNEIFISSKNGYLAVTFYFYFISYSRTMLIKILHLSLFLSH